MYTFYYYPGACSKACYTLLEDLGVPYQAKFVNLEKGEQYSPEYTKVNPRNQVPAFQDGDFYLYEGAAIMMYLFDKNPNCKLMPKDYPARAKAYEGMMYMNSYAHQLYSQYFAAKKYYDAATFAKVEKFYYEKFTKFYDDMEKYYGQYKYYAGEYMTMADIMFTIFANWNQYIGFEYKFGPNCQRVMNAVNAYPAYKAVTEKETQAYKTAQAA